MTTKRYVVLRSLCAVVDLLAAVNKIKLSSFAMEMQDGFAFYR